MINNICTLTNQFCPYASLFGFCTNVTADCKYAVDNVRRLWHNERKKEVAMNEKKQHLHIRVSAEELEKIKEKAAARHLAVSAYVRMILLEEKEVQHD